jgi:hypothetical protein
MTDTPQAEPARPVRKGQRPIGELSARPEEDMFNMHDHYGIHDIVNDFKPEQLRALMEFRLGCMREELNETDLAFADKDADGFVDGIIDLVVFAVGTLDLLQVDFSEAWYRVYEANMNKSVGIKATRPNPLGLPDLVKNPGWVPPNHEDNTGFIEYAFEQHKL